MKLIFTLISFVVVISVSAQEPVALASGTPGPSPSIRIRCGKTNIGPNPLLVIDGFLYEYDQLPKLDPNDIESIDILKEAAASAICGCRGANGVIIITTKSFYNRKFIVKDLLSGAIIPNASISFRSANDSLRTMTDSSGVLITNKLKSGADYSITVSSAGYKTFSSLTKSKEQEILLERDVKENGNVIVAVTCRLRKTVCTSWYSIIKEPPIEDRLEKNNVRPVYPNPVQRSNMFTIELESSKAELLQLAILGMNGSVVSVQSKNVSKGFNRLSIAADARWSAGIYNIQLRNEKGTLVRQEKLIVQ